MIPIRTPVLTFGLSQGRSPSTLSHPLYLFVRCCYVTLPTRSPSQVSWPYYTSLSVSGLYRQEPFTGDPCTVGSTLGFLFIPCPSTSAPDVSQGPTPPSHTFPTLQSFLCETRPLPYKPDRTSSRRPLRHSVLRLSIRSSSNVWGPTRRKVRPCHPVPR